MAGVGKGLGDTRGQVFLEYIQMIKDKKPLFSWLKMSPGCFRRATKNRSILSSRNLGKLGYYFTYKLLNVKDYGVPQDRKRVIFVGYDKRLGKKFTFPDPVAA